MKTLWWGACAFLFGLLGADASAQTLNNQDVAVVIIDYDGNPYADSKENYRPDPEFIQEIFAGSLGGISVADFFNTVSKGKTFFRRLDFFGPYFISKKFYCDHERSDLWPTLTRTLKNDLDFSKYNRVVFITPHMMPSNHCSFLGKIAAARAELQCINIKTANGTKCINFAWIGWTRAMQGLSPTIKLIMEKQALAHHISPQLLLENERDVTIDAKVGAATVITHEMLHGFGLMHANILDSRQPEVILPIGEHPFREEYGDPSSVMSSQGSTGIGWLSGPHLEYLGWLDSSDELQITKTGDYNLVPLSSKTLGLKVLKIARSRHPATDTNPTEYLWIEFRQPLTEYDYISKFGKMSDWSSRRFGGLVHLTSKKYYSNTEVVLLNFNQKDSMTNPFKADFRLQGKWKDPYSNISIEVLNQNSDSLSLHVEL